FNPLLNFFGSNLQIKLDQFCPLARVNVLKAQVHSQGNRHLANDAKTFSYIISSTNNSPSGSNATNESLETPFQKAFIAGLAVLLAIGLFTLGCKLDMYMLLDRLKRPVNVLIGMICQFVIMPCIASAIIMIAKFDWISAFGLFTCAISPGGGASNIYTDMFNGDIDLSVVMTFLSSVASFGTVPLWLLFMQKVLLPEELNRETDSIIKLKVPYGKIASSLFMLVITSVLGLLVRHFFPDIAKKISKIIRYIAIIFLFYVIVIGTVAYYTIFTDLDWKLVLSSMMLPWIGYLIGAIASIITKRSKLENIAITLETGIQNTGIAIFISREALDRKEYSKAIVAPVFYAISTPILVMVCFGLRMIIENIRKKKEIKRQSNPSTDEQT
ncbi:hypothetical protein GJ496_010801, partial [Pomphorhynchus laevis]